MKEPWIVYVIQNGTRHVYGPMPQGKAAALYRQFSGNRAACNVDGIGLKSETLFKADEALAAGPEAENPFHPESPEGRDWEGQNTHIEPGDWGSIGEPS